MHESCLNFRSDLIVPLAGNRGDCIIQELPNLADIYYEFLKRMGRSLDEITKNLEVVGLEKKRSEVYRLVYFVWTVCMCYQWLY